MPATVLLRTSDDQEFSVDLDVISQSKMISTMIKDLDLETAETPVPIPLPNVDAAMLEKVVEYCRQHKDEEIAEVPKIPGSNACEVPDWDKEFLTVEQGVLISIVYAANYLDIPALLTYSCQMVADLMKHKKPEQLRKEFEIECDFTEEELNNLKAENLWCAE